jgi:hypothetical protein
MKYIIANDGTVSAMVAGKSYVFGEGHPSYGRLVAYLEAGNVEFFEASYDIVSRVNDFCEGYVSCENGSLSWDGIHMPEMFTERILDMIQEGFPFEPMLNFLDKLSQNPSDRAIVELFDFMNHKHMPITSDGCFLAYKAVDKNFKDIYSGSFDNSVGSTCEVPRDSVDSNRDRGCSNGLHVGAIDYAAQYGGIDLGSPDDEGGGNNIVICKVSPMDVVSVPTCSSFQKLRCSKYEVVSLFNDVFDVSVHMTEDDINRKKVNRDEQWRKEVAVKLNRVKEVLVKTRALELV